MDTDKKAPKYKRNLQWGETPWDDMGRDDLLKEVWRMYMALGNLHSVVEGQKLLYPNSVFYAQGGRGGAALEKGRQILEPILGDDETRENIYRSFFRYAGDLLFDKNGFALIGSGWVVCDTCGIMIGHPEKVHDGKPCTSVSPKSDCDGTMHRLQWSDLRKDANQP